MNAPKKAAMPTMDWSRIHQPFVYAALAIALTAGFGFGAILVGALAFDMRVGPWYSALAQAHGHAQLFGWVGLFVLGMGLYFLPRLRGTKLQGICRAPWALGLLAAGIGLRSAAQPLAGWLGTNAVLRALFLLSALLELAGMLTIVSMLVSTERAEKPLSPDAPAYPVEPFAQLAFISLTLAYVFNLLGVWNAVSESKNLLAPRYDQLVILLAIYGMAIPMALVFSIRNLPLFLRIELPPRGSWRTLTVFYFVGLVLVCAPFLLSVVDDGMVLTGRVLRANFINVLLLDALAVVGALLLNLCILLCLWQLGLWRRRAPVTSPTAAALGTETQKGRTGLLGASYPDHGEYGRFELLIYSAYAWLLVSVILEILRALPVVDEMLFVPQDAARHALTVGFITLLIFGMGARMLPGFSGKRGVAYPLLVLWTFILGHLAALFRVVPVSFPQSELAGLVWGLSGVVGWLAVLLFAIQVVATFRLE